MVAFLFFTPEVRLIWRASLNPENSCPKSLRSASCVGVSSKRSIRGGAVARETHGIWIPCRDGRLFFDDLDPPCSPLCFSSQAQVSPEPSDLVMVDLTCDSSVDPFGVDDPQPRLHWSLKARGEQLRNVQQTAFQILVASSRTRLDRDSADVWDTNKTSTSMAPSVSYAGPPLVSDTVYYWKVRVWDQRGRPSTWSETATFLTALLQPSDWHAHWIAADPDGPRQPHARGNDDMRVAFAPPTAHLSRYVSSQQACRPRYALPFRPR